MAFNIHIETYMKHKNSVDELNDCSLEFYFWEDFMYGKYNHVQFYFSSQKSFGCLNLIHYCLAFLKFIQFLRICIY